MNKYFSLVLLVGLFTSYSVKADEESMEYEITMKIKVMPSNDPSEQTKCDIMAMGVQDMAQECANCSKNGFDSFLENICACMKEMGGVLASCPCVQGKVAVTIKNEYGQGVGGVVRKQ